MLAESGAVSFSDFLPEVPQPFALQDEVDVRSIVSSAVDMRREGILMRATSAALPGAIIIWHAVVTGNARRMLPLSCVYRTTSRRTCFAHVLVNSTQLLPQSLVLTTVMALIPNTSMCSTTAHMQSHDGICLGYMSCLQTIRICDQAQHQLAIGVNRPACCTAIATESTAGSSGTPCPSCSYGPTETTVMLPVRSTHSHSSSHQLGICQPFHPITPGTELLTQQSTSLP